MIANNNNIEYLKSDYFQIEREYLQDNLIDNILSNINAYLVFEKFTETTNSVLLSETHYILAEIHQNQSNNNMTIEHYEKSLLFQNYLIEKYDLSIYYYLEILNNKQFDHDNKQINMLHNCLVYCYLKLKQYDLAIKYANLALTISEKSLNITYLIRQKIYEIQ
ncbi:unnamed protein product [Rotaria sordida]|uniref:Tetratricopeptide repeat protein n=1 Tax=Rotaria sordida TaxID=392033 RepID=A0A819NW20_9BILA|nr:unnamed protein product [Rotaria sordida]